MSSQLVEVFRKNTTRIKSISFHPVLPTFLTANHCGTIYLWSYHYLQVIRSLNEHTGSVRTICFHPSGELFATGGDDKLVRIWNYKSLKVVHRLKGHSDYIRSVSFHPTHPWLISASDDCTVSIWNTYSGELIYSSSGHQHYVMNALFIDSTHFVSASLDHTICLWDCSNLFEKTRKFMTPAATLQQTLEAHDRGVNTLYYKDGILYSGADDREIKKWKYSGEILSLEDTYFAHDGNVTAVNEINGMCIGVSEDGSVTLCARRKTQRIEIGARLWCVAIKNDLVAVGSDDGLVLYRYSDVLLASNTVNGVVALLYDSNLKVLDLEMNKISGNYKINNESGKVVRIEQLKNNRVLIEYNEKYNEDIKISYEIIKDNSRYSSDLGSYTETSTAIYRLRNGELSREVGSDVTAISTFGTGTVPLFMVSDSSGVFIVSGHTLYYYADDSDEPLVYHSSFDLPRHLVVSKSIVGLIGLNRIILLDRSLRFIDLISEKCEVMGAAFIDLGIDEPVFVYSTMRQLKYYMGGTGTLLSIDKRVIPLAAGDSSVSGNSTVLGNSCVLVLSSQGVEKLKVSFGEVLFRHAVLNDGDERILKIIEEEHLPGRSPLKYLVSSGKGEVALPYIQDAQGKFEVLVSSGRFEEAYQLCESKKMYEELAESALRNCEVDVAERCFKELNDPVGLFFLYLTSKQTEKLSTLYGTVVETMAKLVLGDDSVLGVGSREDGMDSKADVASVTQTVEKIKITQGDQAGDQNSSQPADKNHYSDISSSTDKTGYATMNDSEPQHFAVFDVELFREQQVPEETPEELLRRGLELTTEGKFNGAVGLFRGAILAFAQRMMRMNHMADQFVELRRKVGIYLWGLHVEIERRKLQEQSDKAEDKPHTSDGKSDTGSHSKLLEMALFFASLPLEKKHSELALKQAMNICYKNGNVRTAKRLAAGLKGTRKADKILGDPSDEDRYELRNVELSYDTLEYEEDARVCSMCFIKSKYGENCGACLIGHFE